MRAYLHNLHDCFQHCLWLLQYIVVPEAHYPDSQFLQVPRSLGIVRRLLRLGMLPAIQLDTQLGFVAVEIQDVAPQWMLSAELEPQELAIPQQ